LSASGNGGVVFGKLRIWAVAAAVALAAVAAAYFRGRSEANSDAQVKGYQNTIDKMRTAREVDREIEILDDTGLADRASKWLRDAGK